ncbi:MAG: hypothetical protein QRY74_01720 [Chlamydia sp.]
MEQSNSSISATNPLNATFRMGKDGPVVRSRRWYDKIFEWILPGKYEQQKCDCLIALAKNSLPKGSASLEDRHFLFSAVATLKKFEHRVTFFKKIEPGDAKIKDVAKSAGVIKPEESHPPQSEKLQEIHSKGQFYLKHADMLRSLYSLEEQLHTANGPNTRLLQEVQTLCTNLKMSPAEKRWFTESVDFVLSALKEHIQCSKGESPSASYQFNTEPKNQTCVQIFTELNKLASEEIGRSGNELIEELKSKKELGSAFSELKKELLPGKGISEGSVNKLYKNLMEATKVTKDFFHTNVEDTIVYISKCFENANLLDHNEFRSFLLKPEAISTLSLIQELKNSLSEEKYREILEKNPDAKNFDAIIRSGATQEFRMESFKHTQEVYVQKNLNEEQSKSIEGTFDRAQDRVYVGKNQVIDGKKVPFDAFIRSFGDKLYGDSKDEQKMGDLQFLLYSISNQIAPHSLYTSVLPILQSFSEIDPTFFTQKRVEDGASHSIGDKYHFSYDSTDGSLTATGHTTLEAQNSSNGGSPETFDINFSATIKNGQLQMTTDIQGSVFTDVSLSG